mmetsp:Transcript_12706/g.40639  ORF Transcript_12706/g.40639 Transcript_12706/m.40639 type:complete len:221 (-) Transcript_12706:894-1556(-)
MHFESLNLERIRIWASWVARCRSCISRSNLSISRCTERTIKAAQTTSPLSAGPRSFMSPSMISPTSKWPLPLASMMSKSLARSVMLISRSSKMRATFGSCNTSSKTSRETAICMVSSSMDASLLESGSRYTEDLTLSHTVLRAACMLAVLVVDVGSYLFRMRVQIRRTICRSSCATRTCSLVRACWRFCWLTLAVSKVFSTKIAMTRLKTPNITKHTRTT